jgi:hypothetical protein
MFGVVSAVAPVQQAHRFALAPTPEQEEFLSACAGASRFWFNQGLALVKERLDRRAADEDVDVPWVPGRLCDPRPPPGPRRRPPRRPTPTPAAAPPAPPATPPTPAAAPQGDFCGSSYFNTPELWFTSACEGHDRCYAAHRGKAACDSAFLRDMLATCEHVGSSSGGVGAGVTRASCRAAARLYYKAVVIGGGPSYRHRLVCREE